MRLFILVTLCALGACDRPVDTRTEQEVHQTPPPGFVQQAWCDEAAERLKQATTQIEREAIVEARRQHCPTRPPPPETP